MPVLHHERKAALLLAARHVPQVVHDGPYALHLPCQTVNIAVTAACSSQPSVTAESVATEIEM